MKKGSYFVTTSRGSIHNEDDLYNALVEEHLGDTGGEPGIAYIKGDLMQPEAILRIDEFIESLRDIDNVAETPSGEITIGPNVVNVSRRIMASKSTLKQIEEESGIIIQDADLNGIPDSREDTELVFRHALSYGISDDLGNIIMPYLAIHEQNAKAGRVNRYLAATQARGVIEGLPGGFDGSRKSLN